MSEEGKKHHKEHVASASAEDEPLSFKQYKITDPDGTPVTVKSMGAYELLRQTFDDTETELRRSFPSIYRELLSVAFINIVEDDEDCTGRYQALYDTSVLSLWWPGLNLGSKHLKEIADWILLPQNRRTLLDFLHTGVDLADFGLTGELDTHDLKRWFSEIKGNNFPRSPYMYVSNLINSISEIYRNHLDDRILYAYRTGDEGYWVPEMENDDYDNSKYDDEENWQDPPTIQELLDEAAKILIIYCPTYVRITPVPPAVQEFIDKGEYNISFSPVRYFEDK